MAWALLEIVVPLILAVLLGILIGWFLWRWRRTKVTHTEWASMQMRANSGERAATEIQGLTTDLEGRDADLAACRARVAELEAELEAAKAGGGADEPDSDDAGADEGGADEGGADEGGADEGGADEAGGGHEIQGLTGAAAVADAAADAGDADAGDAGSGDAADEAAESANAGDSAADDGADDEATADDGGADEDAVVGGERHPYGEGSHAPFAADAKVVPDGYDIKGNADSMLYHRPDSRVYGATIAEVWFDTPERAEAAGFTLAGSHPKDSSGGDGADDSADVGAAEERTVVGGERHPYGEGSHAPFDGAEGDMPEGYPIKGNADSMLYHREDSRSYKATIPEVWFDTPERAEAAGFGLANSHPKD